MSTKTKLLSRNEVQKEAEHTDWLPLFHAVIEPLDEKKVKGFELGREGDEDAIFIHLRGDLNALAALRTVEGMFQQSRYSPSEFHVMPESKYSGMNPSIVLRLWWD